MYIKEYMAGYEAFKAGVAKDNGPWFPFDEEFLPWEAGWVAAEANAFAANPVLRALNTLIEALDQRLDAIDTWRTDLSGPSAW